MKKMITILLAALMLLAFVACGGDSAEPAPTPTPTPVPVWAATIEEFEYWTNEYIATCKTFMENPNDIDIYNKMVEMLEEADVWDQRVSEMEETLAEDSAALAAFNSEINRVVQIMSDFSASIGADGSTAES